MRDDQVTEERLQELEIFRTAANRFVKAEIVPHYAQWESDGIVPRSLWQKLGRQGLLAVDIPEAYGGYGSDFSFSMVVVEALMQANCCGLGTSVTVHSDIVAHYILNQGTEAQKQQYLPQMVTGDCIGAVAMTEPGTGSDLQAVTTTAKRDGDDYVINGAKTFITNGQHADVIIVVAKTNTDVAGSKGTSLFLVDASAEGFSRGRNLEKIGLHASDTSELFFNDVRVPATAILGKLDQGFGLLMHELKRERLALAIGAVASAEGVLEETVSYSKERKAFGAPLATLQNTRFKLAEVATDIRIHRAFVEECKTSFLGNNLDVASASMAKVSCTEMQGRVADTCLQLFGGYGFMREYGISRAYTDARVQRIYGGTSEIMKELISRDLLA
jgi:acyl-CoA dehydrogenase